MMVTIVRPEMLRALLIRGGVWLVDAVIMSPTDYYHKQCFNFRQRPRPRPELAIWAMQLDPQMFRVCANPLHRRVAQANLSTRARLDFGR